MEHTFRTYANGSRVEMDDAGWRFYRDGKLAASIGSDGSAWLAGRIRTALTGCRREIDTHGMTEVHEYGCLHTGNV